MELNVVAIDIAKKVFQLHWVEPETGCIERLKMKRARCCNGSSIGRRRSC
jgi:hypothetical protein